jgi:Alpha amylase, catalytic domain/Secretion system C-terminal sorting domain/Carbohydrate-binding module 48 (Isoamylase N-terminal domain)/Domain of unknown function (DUF4961)
MKLSRFFTLLLFLVFTQNLLAQIVTLNPVFATDDDVVTITYDATQGNGGLIDEPVVYFHTGVVTNIGGPGNWQHVVGNWGSADPFFQMTPIGNNKHTMTYHIRDFYNVPANEEILELAFVFRNADGSKEGKTAMNGDIFVPIYSANSGLQMLLMTPTVNNLVVNNSDVIAINAAASEPATMTIFDNGVQLTQVTSSENISYNLTVNGTGTHDVLIEVDNGSTVLADSFRYVINPSLTIAEPPAGTQLGLTYVNSTTTRFSLYAPDKEFVYLIGDFNDWQFDVNYFMNRSADGATWWIELNGLTPGIEYGYQYAVDGDLVIADPYSELVLDEANDGWISNLTFPDLKPFPFGKTNGRVSVFDSGKTPYDWQVTNFQAPEETDLVVYEMLLRDFVARHDYQTLLDTLDYLERLGINAIELMPVNEFEGNQSWGYNPSFHMALDKYYGTPEAFKAFVDECHSRGIAVILDIVLNHAFSQSPLCQLYWNAAQFKPSEDNPWLNPDAKHPYNVGYDFNHESQATKDWTDRILLYWLEEYNVDGYRFDLSKGLTQNFSNNDAAFSAYDASRIALIKRMGDVVWDYDPNAYCILEHFAVNTEEKELAEYGFMLWGNVNHQYNEATMGYPSNLLEVSYQSSSNNWTVPHLVSYMESHDEERLMYKNRTFGNSAGSYNVKNIVTGLARMELAAAFYLTIPGPKMLWQFAEIGYDYSIFTCSNGVTISDNCKLDPKPIRWDYLENYHRKRLYQVFSALNKLKRDYDFIRTTDFTISLGAITKRINLNDDDINATIIGNFDVVTAPVNPNFQHTGTWYDYFTGEPIEVANVNAMISLEPGEYHIYTDVPLETPEVLSGLDSPAATSVVMNVYPNPVTNKTITLQYDVTQSATITIDLLTPTGQLVKNIKAPQQTASGMYWEGIDLENLPAGIYFLRVQADGQSAVERIVVSTVDR